MKIENLFPILKNSLPSLSFFKRLVPIAATIAIFLCLNIDNCYANSDRVRTVSEVKDGAETITHCHTEEIDFDPFGSGKDSTWELDNGTCLAYLAASGVALNAALWVGEGFCYPIPPNKNDPPTTASKYLYRAKKTAAIAVTMAGALVPSPETAAMQLSLGAACAYRTATCAYGNALYASGLAIIPIPNPQTIAGIDLILKHCDVAGPCCAAAVANAAVMTAAVGALKIIHEVAVDSQENATICGKNWNIWNRQKDEGNADILDKDGNPIYIYGDGEGSKQEELKRNRRNGVITPDITNQAYREFIYGGVEYEDTGDGDDECENPWNNEKRTEVLGYGGDRQRYYMRGSGVTANYACHRFILYNGNEDEKKSANNAYECCKKRSQNTICIEDTSSGIGADYKFCKIGQNCKVKDVWYEVYENQELSNYICADTYSVCPYNHPLGGGTTKGEASDSCQYLKHCVKKPDTPHVQAVNMDGEWISSACFDLKGDSQNYLGFSADLSPINSKHFSAPIAQCFKETLENMLIHKVGNTKCKPLEDGSIKDPDEDGNCENGYIYKEGDAIEDASFFQVIQDKLRTAIQMAMTLAVTIIGFNILLAGKSIDRKSLMMFILKLALVSFFALGTAWQNFFLEGVSSTSTVLGEIFMQIDEEGEDNKKDGCQFPRVQHDWQDGSLAQDGTAITKYDNPAYPPGKEYLKIWDTLDCKIAWALGLGIEASIPNLLFMMVAGFFTGAAGIVFFIATFIFGFYLIALVVRALHIFLISSMVISILIFISPITITASLFKRTENMFKQWRTMLLSFVLQPVILFCYLGILITIFDKTMMGDAEFFPSDAGSEKVINCSVGDAADNSIYCIFGIMEIGTLNIPGLGIGVPYLDIGNTGNMGEKVSNVIKAAFLVFIFTSFLDKISILAKNLTGSSPLTSGSKGALSSMLKAKNMADGLRKRGARGGTKGLKRAGRAASNMARKIGGRAADSSPNTNKSYAESNTEHSVGNSPSEAPNKK